jgi:hypothetical protein
MAQYTILHLAQCLILLLGLPRPASWMVMVDIDDDWSNAKRD